MNRTKKYFGESLLVGHCLSLCATIVYGLWKLFQGIPYTGSWYADHCLQCATMSLVMMAVITFIATQSNPSKPETGEAMTPIPAAFCLAFTISVLYDLEGFVLQGISAFGITHFILLIAIIVCYVLAILEDEDPEDVEAPAQKAEM